MLIESGPFKGLVRNGYRVVAMDCPWKYLTRSDKGLGRSAERHYHCMSIEELMVLPVGDLLMPGGVVLFWVTDPMLFEAKRVADAYGLKFATVAYYWAKSTATGLDAFGMGFWTRANPEQAWALGFDPEDTEESNQVLMFKQGHPKRRARNVRRLIVAPIREHSRKPEEFFLRTERLLDGPYLELFARQKRPGWSAWGNEVNKFPELADWHENLSPEAMALVDDPFGGLV